MSTPAAAPAAAKPPAKRPVPTPNAFCDTQPFWEGAKQKKLVLQYCPDTKQFQHYPRPVSIYTGKANLEWREVSGKGKIYAKTTTRVPMPGFAERGPYGIVTVELNEGVRIIGLLLNCKPEDAKIGDKVRVSWEELAPDINFPSFELDR